MPSETTFAQRCINGLGRISRIQVRWHFSPFSDAGVRLHGELVLIAWCTGGGPIQLGDVVGNLLFNVQTHNMSLRGDVAGTIVSMSLVEGLVKQLDPHFDVVGCAIPYFNRFPAQLIAAQGFLPKSGAEASVGR